MVMLPKQRTTVNENKNALDKSSASNMNAP
jgi:hypothetical protein